MTQLSISKAWDEAVAFLNREVALIFPLALAFFMLPSAILGWSQPQGSSEPGLGLLATMVLLLTLVTGQVAIARLAIGWDGSVGSAIALAFRRVWSFIAASVIVYAPLIVVGLVILASILLANGIGDPAAITPQRLAQMPSLALATLALMLVAVAIAARLIAMPALAAAEGLGPLALLKRSFALSRGHFWRLLGLLIALLVASMLINGASTTVAGSLAVLALGPLAPFSASALAAALVSSFIAAIASTVASILTARVFVQLAQQPQVPHVSEKD